MILSSLPTWLRPARRQPGLSPRGTRRRGRVWPRLAALEPRAVPAIFTVTSLADAAIAGGGLTLREAIDGANERAGADVIRFAPGLGGAITLSAGPLQILDDLTVRDPARTG